MAQRILFAMAAALAWTASALPGHAGPITIDGDSVHSTSHVGDFHATLQYVASDAGHATLTVVLKNTTPAYGGYLTAFVLNNPGNAISGFALTGNGNGNFHLILAGSSPNPTNGAPFGAFDFGASTGSSFEGGGSPNGGLAMNQQGTFTFALTGTHLNLLNETSFVNELSVGPGQGQGPEFFVARFRGFDRECPAGSDKVPADVVAQTPEPATLLLGALGICLGAAPSVYRRLRPV